MIVQDLNVSADLDQVALSAVAGGGIISRKYLGATVCSTAWQYKGQTFKFLGYKYVPCKGWKKLYRNVKIWTRTQIFKKHYNVLVC